MALLEIECKEISGQKPVIYSSMEDFSNMLSLFSEIDMLIVDLPDDAHRISVVTEFILNNQSRLKKTFVVGQESDQQGEIRRYKRSEISEMFEELRALCGGEIKKNQWSSIPLSALIHFTSVPFDLYLRLSDKRFVKRVNANEEFGKETLVSMEQKGIEELHFDKRFTRDFSMMLINNMINKVDRSYDNFFTELHAQDEVFKTTKEIIQDLGLSGRVVEVCDAAIDKMTADVMSQKDVFADFLLSLKNDQTMAFHFKLVNLTNYIGTQLILQMNLPNTEEQVKKFVFASFFCDMTLKKPEFFYKRKTEDTLNLPGEDQVQVNLHAYNASEVVSGYKNISKETSLIIRQHHGSFSGIGFTQDKSAQLLPLARILIVSQELAFSILTNADAPILDTLRSFVKIHKVKGLIDLMNVLEASFSETLGKTG